MNPGPAPGPVHERRIDHPAAWTRAGLGGREAITLRFSAAELDAFDALLARTRDRPPQQLQRDDVVERPLIELFARLRDEILDGRGAILLGGLSSRYADAEDLERIYWAIGTHLGHAAVQSRNGDRLGRVERDDTDPVARGYRSAGELSMHTDSYEIVGLLCIRKAARGGESALVSSLAIHNALLAERPDLLPPLYEGFRLAIPEARLGSQPVTDAPIPVFCNVDGVVSCMFAASFIREASRMTGTPLPAGLDEALRIFLEVANRDDLALRFTLEPGEILLWHNFTHLHARTEFEDEPGHRRLLLRLWLTVPGGRRFVTAFNARGAAYDRVHREHGQKPSDAPQGRDAAQPAEPEPSR